MYLKDLNDKRVSIDDINTKSMYTCKNMKGGSLRITNIIGLATIIAGLSYLIFRLASKPSIGVNMLTFVADNEVLKMFIGLLLLSNIKSLTESLTQNIIVPLVKPILPLIVCSLRIKLGLFSLNVGSFASDLVIFGINIGIIYALFAALKG
jgi:hypothetical protein